MKTIFRYANVGLLAGAIFATGAVATFAQDACADTDGMTKLSAQFNEEFKDKTLAGRKKAVATGKSFLEKYGSCEPAKALADYLKNGIPKFEKTISDMEEGAAKDALTARFNNAWKASNWDEVFAAGKEILAKYPDEFRTVEIALATVGGEQAFKNNFKYNDEAIRLAKQSIADIQGGKSFKVGDKEAYGLFDLAFKNKEEALGWLNLYIGYMTQVGQKNKSAALPYLYAATQSSVVGTTNPTPYALIGDYYFEELNKVVDQIQALAKTQSDQDPEDVAKKKVEDIKALVAMSNGISERAMDAFSRAFTYSKDAAYKARMKKNVADAYKVRFAKEDGLDSWITATVAKPFVNPATPVQPVSDPEPAKTTTGSTATPASATAVAPAKTAPAKPKNK